jgi:O-methyltransferase
MDYIASDGLHSEPLTLREQINTALQGTTGFRLTRETTEQRQESIAKAVDAAVQAKERQAEAKRRKLRAELDAARAALREQKRSMAAEKRRLRREVPDEHALQFVDDADRRIIQTVKSRTMTDTVRLSAMIEALRYLVRVRVPGAIVECGVWRGGSMQAAALTLLECQDTERELHLFDTFEGMPPPSDADVRLKDGQAAEEIMQTSGKDAAIWAIAGLDDVKQGMVETGYPSEKVVYHPGLVEETIPDEAPDQIALLRLDTDWYESTRHELDHLYERLSPGGILIIDDYRYWEGSYRATHEWLDETEEPVFLVPTGSARITVKPLVR